MRKLSLLVVMLLAVLVACDTAGDSGGTSGGGGSIPANAIQISIVYAPESDSYMPQLMQEFNDSYRQGLNPITGERLAEGERPIPHYG